MATTTVESMTKTMWSSRAVIPGGTTSFSATLINTAGQTGYFRAWFDLNQNGQFETNELVVNDVTETGLVTRSVTVPQRLIHRGLVCSFPIQLDRWPFRSRTSERWRSGRLCVPLAVNCRNAVPDFVTITNDGNNPTLLMSSVMTLSQLQGPSR